MQSVDHGVLVLGLDYPVEERIHESCEGVRPAHNRAQLDHELQNTYPVWVDLHDHASDTVVEIDCRHMSHCSIVVARSILEGFGSSVK